MQLAGEMGRYHVWRDGEKEIGEKWKQNELKGQHDIMQFIMLLCFAVASDEPIFVHVFC